MIDNDLIRRGDAAEIGSAHGWDTDMFRAAIAALPTAPVTLEWMDGQPPSPWREEWFIAKTIHGDKVVLRALPDDWTYDYTTADNTYMIAENIVCWMQFPDSDYIQPTTDEAPRIPAPVTLAQALEVPEVARLVEAAGWSMTAMESLAGYEADLGCETLDVMQVGRIDDSRATPSFRIQVGHIRNLAAALAALEQKGGA